MIWDSNPTPEEKILTSLEEKCGLVDMGDQILILMIVDLIVCFFSHLIESPFLKVSNFIELFYQKLYNFFTKTMMCKPIPEEDKYGNFEIAEEYLEIIYRQFVLYFSLPYFPAVSILCIFLNCLEYFPFFFSFTFSSEF